MILFRNYFVLLSLVLSFPAFAGEEWKSDFWKLTREDFDVVYVGETYRVDVSDLRPAQFAVGKKGEVRHRREEIAEMGKSKLRRYLKKKIGRVVLGPDKTIWLIDGNHLATALYYDGVEEMLVKVERNWSDLSAAEFFKRMNAAKYLWLYDGEGNGPLDPQTLPASVARLGDDPYRSLAWRVSKAGGFFKRRVPFQEFLWGNYFRANITLAELKASPKAVLLKALKLAISPKASRLPGYRKTCPQLLAGDES